MFNKIRKLFSPKRHKDQLEYNIDELQNGLQQLVVKNDILRLENERLIDKIHFRQKMLEILIRSGKKDATKRCILRRILNMRKRLIRLERCGVIYRDNIQLHETVVEKLEGIRVEGMKIITADMLEEIAIDNEEKCKTHRDLIRTADVLNKPDYIEDDEGLKNLIKELEV